MLKKIQTSGSLQKNPGFNTEKCYWVISTPTLGLPGSTRLATVILHLGEFGVAHLELRRESDCTFD